MDASDPASFFGADTASTYDDHPRGDEEAAAKLLSELSGGRPALEFAIGTGRIALPLIERGVEVHGIELSPHMVEVLRAKPNGANVPVTVGDMATARVPGTFGLAYLVYNTIFNLVTQDAQIACFVNAARHLSDDGVFVVETAVPSAWTSEHAYVRPEWIESGSVGLDVVRYDAATQIFEENHVRLSAAGIQFGPIVCRLIWPAEMDLMARIAGLTLIDRWGGWSREPFTGQSTMHVSVYGRASA
jgi:cyclopropane fatty-acyl-phospholipid synthase-like methyltransferase